VSFRDILQEYADVYDMYVFMRSTDTEVCLLGADCCHTQWRRYGRNSIVNSTKNSSQDSKPIPFMIPEDEDEM
jgi:hypothetical protein